MELVREVGVLLLLVALPRDIAFGGEAGEEEEAEEIDPLVTLFLRWAEKDFVRLSRTISKLSCKAQ